MEFDEGSSLEGQSDSYEIIRRLGEGGFGVTYRARGKRDHKQVVVKTLRIDRRVENWKSLELFEREGQVLKSLRGERRLGRKQMVDWFWDMLKVCAYLHEQSPPVLHRDISPKNIILSEKEGHPVLIDFGRPARSSRRRRRRSRTATVAGPSRSAS